MDSNAEPEFVISDFAKMDRSSTLHIAFQAIHSFENPQSGNKDEDADAFIKMCHEKMENEYTFKVRCA